MTKVTKKYLKRNAALSTIFILFFILTLFLINYYYNSQSRFFLSKELLETQRGFDISLKGYQRSACLVFNEKINNSQTSKILYQAIRSGSLAERARLRADLQKAMAGTYTRLRNWGYRQLHFHLSDNTSFLRMHRPEKFGDDLTDIRETVRLVNTDHKYIEGFEEGRIYNGYRFVFPIQHKGEHVGSVEISISLSACGNAMKSLYDDNFKLLMDKQVVQQKLFSEELENYRQSTLGDNYYVDKETDHAPCLYAFSSDKNFTVFRDKLAAGFAAEEDFIEIFQLKDTIHLVKFLSIRNISNKTVGYMVLIEESILFNTFSLIKERIATFTIGLFILIMVLLQLFFYFKNRSEELKNFIPICSSCKKIRKPGANPREENSWMSLEAYFTSKTITSLSHGYCPSCIKDFEAQVRDITEAGPEK